jgi:glycosyltransferase involved in cell wall biosynthesis
MKIVHLTSVHPRNDTRIFLKQCRSLAANGYDVALIVADGKGDELRDNVRIIDAGASRGRLDRAYRASRRVLRRAVEADATLYHLHDPELLPIGLALKRRGKRVIFDSHEDIPRDILTKPYIPKGLRPLVSRSAATVERMICARLDGVIAATPFIRDNYCAMGIRCIDINNFPMLGELETEAGWNNKQNEVCYIGGMALNRGILEIIRAMELLQSQTRLNLVGQLAHTAIGSLSLQETGWPKVNALGFLDRDGVRRVLERSVAGLVTLHPVVTFLDSLPIKMFEYMSAGIPVIASNFPFWRKIVESHECGVLVDPLDPLSIASAIDRLIGNPDMARKMGENGSRAVKEGYNWEIEEKKLLGFYTTIIA